MTKITTDYHMHSTFSADGKDTIEALCWRALALGYTEIAITEHAEWHDGGDGFASAAAYFAEIERCRNHFAPRGLTLLSGVEMGNPHEYKPEARALLAAFPFDVKIASLHWLYGENIHLASCFAGCDPDDVYADYFTALGQMAAEFDPVDVIAHFDRVLWRGSLLGATFEPTRLENVIREALATIAWRDIALELNTRFLNHSPGWNDALFTMLCWFREEGGTQIVVNSDAHRVAQVGANVAIAETLLESAGFEAPTRLMPLMSLAV